MHICTLHIHIPHVIQSKTDEKMTVQSLQICVCLIFFDTHTFTHTCTHTHTRIHKHTHIHTHKYTHTRTHTFSHSHTHAHTHTTRQIIECHRPEKVCAIALVEHGTHARTHTHTYRVKSSNITVEEEAVQLV